MSDILSAKDICERALRVIGAFPITESAPDGEHLREAMFWLDMALAELSGTVPLFFQRPEPVAFALEAGTQVYRLSDALGASYPANGIQFPREAWLEDGAGNRHPLTIVSRNTWAAKERPGEEGTPREVYIDRLIDGPTLHTYPTLRADDSVTWTLYLDVQTFSPNVAPGGVTGSQPQGSIRTDIRPAWQRWAVYQVAMDIGSGPVAKISESSLRRFEEQAARARRQLEAFENREHDNEAPVAEAYWID